MTGTEVTGIPDDYYRSIMGVIVISLETRRNAVEIFECTWKGRRTHAEIANKLWEMPGFVLILIWRRAGGLLDTLDVNEQPISLNRKYDAWIIVHYYF